MPTYLVLEIGKSAQTQIKHTDGEFKETDDAVLIDEVVANSENEACELVQNKHKNKEFHRLIARRVLN